MLVFSALADPTRLRIVEMLASQGQLSASHIGEKFTISPPAISQHLKVLREAKLVQVEVRAQQRIYSINRAGISEVDRWTRHMQEFWTLRFDALDELLKQDDPKPKKPRRRSKHAKSKI